MPVKSGREETLRALPFAEDAALPLSRLGKRGTVVELVKVLGFAARTVRRHLKELENDGRAFIGKWDQGQRYPTWFAGQGVSVSRPDRVAHAVYCKKYRKNVKRAVKMARNGSVRYDARYAGRVALALADDVAKRTIINPQNPFSALGL